MIKHKKISFLMSGFLLAGVVIIGAQSALAYLTDYKSVVNTISSEIIQPLLKKNFQR